jgi:predicted MPP superfamily phosphohydrolase
MIGVNNIKVEKIRWESSRLGEALAGLKIIHLSDLHIARSGVREKRLVRLVNDETPDLILITGDSVVNYTDDFQGCIQTLGQLKARHGVFAVHGNAEHAFQPRQVLADFEAALREVPIHLLNNRHAELKLNGRTLYLAGVDDPFFQFDDFDQAVEGIPFQAPTLLLAHSPDILFPRADALVISLLDSPFRKNHFREWGWIDRSQFSPENGDVFFQSEGTHAIRVQTRQAGVSLDAIILSPYPEVDGLFRDQEGQGVLDLLQGDGRILDYPDLIVVPASEIREEEIHGKWKKEGDPSAVSAYRLADLPPRNRVSFQPLIDPPDYFEARFTAKSRTKYHVWIRMKAHKGSPLHDSVYLQFSDSVDERGKERYRIGKPACSKERLADVDLILTGHTHGGQIRVPFMPPFATMASLGHRYISGMYRVGKSRLYVSRGVGCSVLPVRTFCAPEVTVFEF